jgi:hypothetical protein
MLVHPGMTRLHATLHQHFTWPSMKKDIQMYLKQCDVCQKAKQGGHGYGKIPQKDVEQCPWRDVCVDLSGLWKAKIDKQDVSFHALTIIDPFTSSVEIVPVLSKKKNHICDLFEQEWL